MATTLTDPRTALRLALNLLDDVLEIASELADNNDDQEAGWKLSILDRNRDNLVEASRQFLPVERRCGAPEPCVAPRFGGQHVPREVWESRS